MKRKIWTAEEDQYMREQYPHKEAQWVADQLGRSLRSIYNRARILSINKTAEFMSQMVVKSNLAELGKKHRYREGSEPVNKGKKQTEYMTPEAIEKSKATRFKKGNKPANTKYDGHISVRYTKGRPYQWVRIELGEYQLLHRVLWEAHHGKIPSGHIVKFKDGNSMNCVIENLGLISREKNMQLNTIHQYPESIKQNIRLINKLNKLINHAKKEHTGRP